jgi:cellulose biosynthesis protein BcsQ
VDPTGKIVTFYSYKGGVGRSMAVANVGILLASWGYKTLMIDLDLEAPGLNYFFVDLAPGRVQRAIDNPERGALDVLEAIFNHDSHKVSIGIHDSPVPLSLPGIEPQKLLLLGAGHFDDDYYSRVRRLDAHSAYSNRNAGVAAESFRDQLRDAYDFVLIDSRTGNTEIGGLNTVQLPDLIAALFTPTQQALLGVLDILNRAERARQRLPFPRPRVPILPVPSRIDVSAEYQLSQRWFRKITQEFEAFIAPWIPIGINAQRFYENVKLPQIPYFGYGERLPVIEQGTSDPAGLGYAYENIAALLAQNLTDVGQFLDRRDQYISGAARGKHVSLGATSEPPHVYLSYSHADQVWANRLLVHLKPLVGRLVIDQPESSPIPGGDQEDRTNELIQQATVALLLVSADYLASEWVLSTELPALVHRDIPVLMLLIRPSLWEATPLSSYQAVNDPKRPLSTLSKSEQDQILTATAEAINGMLERRGY